MIGNNSSRERTKKTESFVDTEHALNTRLLNTWCERTVHNWTCAFMNREARQLDYVGVDRMFADSCSAEVFDSSATCSGSLSYRARQATHTHLESSETSQADWLETHRFEVL